MNEDPYNRPRKSEPTRLEQKEEINDILKRAEYGVLSTDRAIRLIENGHGLLVLKNLSGPWSLGTNFTPIIQELLVQDYVEETLLHRKKFPGPYENSVVLAIHQIPEEGAKVLAKYRNELTDLPPKIFRTIFPDATPEEIMSQSQDIEPVEIENLETSLGLPYLIEHIDRFSIPAQKILLQKSIDVAPYLVAKNILSLDDSLQIGAIDHLLHSAQISYEEIFSFPSFVEATVKHLMHFTQVPKAVADKMLALTLIQEVIQNISHFNAAEQVLIIEECLREGRADIVLENFKNIPTNIQDKIIEKIITTSEPSLLASQLQNIPVQFQELALLQVLVADVQLAAACIPKVQTLSNSTAEKFINAGLSSVVISNKHIFVAYPFDSLLKNKDLQNEGDVITFLPELSNQSLELAERLIGAGHGEAVFQNVISFKDKFHPAIFKALARSGHQALLLTHLESLKSLTPDTGLLLLQHILEERPSSKKLADLITGIALTPEIKAFLNKRENFSDHLEAVYAELSQKRLALNLQEPVEVEQKLTQIKTVEARPDLVMAKEILVQDYLGLEAAVKTFNIDISEAIPPLPFTKERLERAKEQNQLLILRYPMSMKGMIKRKNNKTSHGKNILLNNTSNASYKNYDFYSEIPDIPIRWVLVDRKKTEENTGYFTQTEGLAKRLMESFGLPLPKNIEEAIVEFKDKRSIIQEHYRQQKSVEAFRELQNLQINQLFRRTAGEALYDQVLYYENTGKQILTTFSYDVTKSTGSFSPYPQIVRIGQYQEGMEISLQSPSDRSFNTGVYFSCSE